MGQRAWLPSLCSLPRPWPFLLLLLLLLVVPRGAQPQAGRVSTAPLPRMWSRVCCVHSGFLREGPRERVRSELGAQCDGLIG